MSMEHKIMVSKTGSKEVAWQHLVEDVMPSMGRTPELEWRQKDEDSTDRVVVNLPCMSAAAACATWPCKLFSIT
jgi:hypothetical protein